MSAPEPPVPPIQPTAYAWESGDVADTVREADVAGFAGRYPPGRPPKTWTAQPNAPRLVRCPAARGDFRWRRPARRGR